jgi:ankyrin repeat protein
MNWFDDEPPAYTNEEFKLFKAASRNQLEVVIDLLIKGIRSDIKINGFNTLHAATKKGYSGIIRVLLSHNESLAISLTGDGRSALMIAAVEGHVEACKAIESKGSTTYLLDNDSNNALHYSVWGGHEETTRYLVDECKIDSTIANKEGLLPIQLAAASNQLNLFVMLSGADVESASGFNSLHRASMYGSLETVQHLISTNKVNYSLCTASGSTILHLAAKNGHLAIVRYILDELQIDVDSTDDYKLTALHFSAVGYILTLPY